MMVSEVLDLIEAEITFSRTPWGRRLHNLAISALRSCWEDEGNHNAEAVQCKNCGIIISKLLNPDGCIYCRYPQMDVNIQTDKEN